MSRVEKVKNSSNVFYLFLALEVLFDDIFGLRFFAIVFNNHTTAAHNFTRFSFSVNLAETYPLTKLLVIINLYQIDLMFSTKSFNQLYIHRFIAIGCKNTKMGLAFV